MKKLLDTHVVLWFLNGEKLSGKMCDLIASDEIYISVVSLWEVAIKMNIGKYDFRGGFPAFRNLIDKNGFAILPIKDGYLDKLFEIPLIHRDPFDRLLIATSIAEGIPIITADENIQKYNIAWIWQ